MFGPGREARTSGRIAGQVPSSAPPEAIPEMYSNGNRPARDRHPLPPHPAGGPGGHEAQRVLQQHGEPERSGAQQRPAGESGEPAPVPQGAWPLERVRLLHHLQHLPGNPESAGPAGAAHPGAGGRQARLEPNEPGDHRLHAGAVPGPGRGPGPRRGGEPRRHLAPDLPRRAQHPHAAQPLHRLPHGPAPGGESGGRRQPQPHRRRPAQPVPGLHARCLPPLFRRGAGLADSQDGA